MWLYVALRSPWFSLGTICPPNGLAFSRQAQLPLLILLHYCLFWVRPGPNGPLCHSALLSHLSAEGQRDGERERGMKSLMHLDSLKPSLCHCTCRAARGDRSPLATQPSAHFWKMAERLLASALVVAEIVLVASVFRVCGYAVFWMSITLLTWC